MTAVTPPIRTAILGYGLAGSVFHAPLIAATPGMRVAAIVTNAPERRARAAHDFPTATIYSSADELWRDADRYDLAVIATPNRAHVSLAIAALDAGLAVVVDKPVAPSVASAEQLLEVARRNGKLLTVFQNRRWDGDFLTVRRLIESGVLGEIERLESRFERYRPEPKPGAWRELGAPEEAGGLLYDLGSHLIDQVMQLFGQPDEVYAEVERRRPGVAVDDDTFVALHFPSGVRAHLWMNVVSRRLAPRFRLLGLGGTYEKYGLDPQEPALAAGTRPGDTGWGQEPPEKWGRISATIAGLTMEGAVETLPGTYERFYTLLRDALTQGGPPPVNPEGAIAALRVIEAARESAERGEVIRLGS